MPDRKWNHAAWMAIGAAALTPPNILLSFIADRASARGGELNLLLPLAAVTIGTAAIALSVIALYRFRELLNERYDYHGIDMLVTFLIVAVAGIAVVGLTGRMAMALTGFSAGGERNALALLFVVPMILLQVATGIVSIIAGVRLYGLDNDLESLIRPYAVLSVIGGACFTVVILAPLGMLILVAEHVVLALTFFRASETEPTVEFV